MKNENYNKLINLRNAYKQLSQIMWSIRDCEIRFPMGNFENENQLISFYESMIPKIKDSLKELEKENQND